MRNTLNSIISLRYEQIFMGFINDPIRFLSINEKKMIVARQITISLDLLVQLVQNDAWLFIIVKRARLFSNCKLLLSTIAK